MVRSSKPDDQTQDLFSDREPDEAPSQQVNVSEAVDAGNEGVESPQERDTEAHLVGLQELHRALSEQIVATNRELAKSAAGEGVHADVIATLQTKRAEFQQQRLELELEIKLKLGAFKRPNKKHRAHVDRAELDAETVHDLVQEEERAEKGLIKQRHPNRDFFLADLFDYALKDDGASMEAPIFTLSTKPDLSVWQWKNKDGSKSIKVAPSVLGRATQHDKDVLIYVVSQLTEALNRGREDAQNRTVRFTVYDFLAVTNRGVSGDDYMRLQQAFERLAGTRITTDIRTGGERVKQGFGIIDEWRIIERAPDDERMIAVEVTLSRWLYNAVQAFEVLTIHPDYFRLRKPLARRLYELARKHCGHQSNWSIGLALLQEKSGSKSSLREFRRGIKAVSEDDSLPEYRMVLDDEDKVTFYARSTYRSIDAVARMIARK